MRFRIDSFNKQSDGKILFFCHWLLDVFKAMAKISDFFQIRLYNRTQMQIQFSRQSYIKVLNLSGVI